MDKMHTYQAFLLADGLAKTLHIADAIERYARQDATYHHESADEWFRELAEHLGYTVKRDAQQEAA